MKLEAALILAGITKRVIDYRYNIQLQNAITGELIEALRTVTEKELLCQVLLAVFFHVDTRQCVKAALSPHSHSEMREALFDHGLKNILIVRYSTFSDDIEVTRTILRVLSSLFQPRPPIHVAQITDLLPILSTALHSSDILTVSHAATAFSLLFDSDEGNEILRLDSSIAPTLIQLMMHAAVEVIEPALKAVGNIISQNDEDMVEAMIQLQVIPSLLWLVDYPTLKIRREALWSLSNIATGNHSQIQAVIDTGVIPRIMPLMKSWKNKNYDERSLYEETAIILGNILSNGTNDQKKYLLTEHVFEAFCDALRNPRFLNEQGSDKELRVLLNGVFHFLRFAQTDYVDSKEIISSLFKKEKLLNALKVIKKSKNRPYNAGAWLEQVLTVVKELNFA